MVAANLTIVISTLILVLLTAMFSGYAAYGLLLPYAVLMPVIAVAVMASLFLTPNYLERWGSLSAQLRLLLGLSALCGGGWILLIAVSFLL